MYADVAKLADAQVSGTCECKLLSVQIRPSAPLHICGCQF